MSVKKSSGDAALYGAQWHSSRNPVQMHLSPGAAGRMVWDACKLLWRGPGRSAKGKGRRESEALPKMFGIGVPSCAMQLPFMLEVWPPISEGFDIAALEALLKQ